MKLFKGLAAVLALSVALSSACASAASAEFADYDKVYQNQKTYYQEVYKPAYKSYNQTIRELRTAVRETEFETREQLERVREFIADLTERRWEFFGDRTTVGKSRYEVPAVRTAMYEAADHQRDYDTGIALCGDLLQLVEARVGFLNGLAAEIADFELIESGELNAPKLLDELASSGEVTTKILQNAVLEKYGSFPKLSEAEKSIAVAYNYNNDVSLLDWRPIVAVGGEIFLTASKSNQSTNNPLACMIYYNGDYYYWCHRYVMKDAYISDFVFDISNLDYNKTELSEINESAWLRYVG